MNAQEANKIATETRRKFIETLPVKEEIAACLEEIKRTISYEAGAFEMSYCLKSTDNLGYAGRQILKEEFIREMTNLKYTVRHNESFLIISW